MQTEPLKLPTQQQLIYDVVKQGGDVPILDIHRAVFIRDPEPGKRSPWVYAQQQLGPAITRLNRRLAKRKLAVKPGDMKGTYRLVSL